MASSRLTSDSSCPFSTGSLRGGQPSVVVREAGRGGLAKQVRDHVAQPVQSGQLGHPRRGGAARQRPFHGVAHQGRHLAGYALRNAQLSYNFV